MKPPEWACDECKRTLTALVPPEQFDVEETPANYGLGIRRGERVDILCAKCCRDVMGDEGGGIEGASRTQLILETELRKYPGQFVAFDSTLNVIATGKHEPSTRDAAINRGAHAPLVLYSGDRKQKPEPMTPRSRLHLRIDERNGTHVKLTVFMEGANCGQLTFRNPELTIFMKILAHGWSEAGVKLEITEATEPDAKPAAEAK